MLQRLGSVRATWSASLSGRRIIALVAPMLLAVFAAAPAQAVEARSFVISWFALATNPTEKDCPGVPFGSPGVIAHTSLLLQGHSEQEADRMTKEFLSVLLSPERVADNDAAYEQAEKQFADFTTRRARINGKPADAYLNPTAAPNPKIPRSANRMQYGFNLDGKGGDAKDGIEDPETREKGVDNEYARAVGCMTPFRAKTNTGSATETGGFWGETRSGTRASLVTVVGEDLSKDGEVVVLIRRSLDAPLLDSKGDAQADGTFRVDPEPQALNIFRGKLQKGVVNSVEPIDFRMLAFHEYRLLRSRLRIELKPDGTAQGMIGGYRPWRDVYSVYTATTGREWEFMSTLNVVGLYYNLREYADAFPDETGQNTTISAAYKFAAVPAFVATPGGKLEQLQLEALLEASSNTGSMAGVN